MKRGVKNLESPRFLPCCIIITSENTAKRVFLVLDTCKEKNRTKMSSRSDFSSTAANVVKFDGTNFQLWKFQIMPILMASDVWGVIDGTRPKPGENASTSSQCQWNRLNAKATCIIHSTMTQDQLVNLMVCKTAAEEWKRLLSLHEEKSETNKLALLQRFH